MEEWGTSITTITTILPFPTKGRIIVSVLSFGIDKKAAQALACTNRGVVANCVGTWEGER